MLIPEKYYVTEQWKYIFKFEKRAVDNYPAFQTLNSQPWEAVFRLY